MDPGTSNGCVGSAPFLESTGLGMCTHATPRAIMLYSIPR